MTRLRTDQACLDAQLQAQAAQSLTAELAVACPDCGVEAGRACRDSFDRAVKSHLGRVVAANRRDTEPCPAPSDSLERASARAFAENLLEEVDRFYAACDCCLASPGADGAIEHRPLCFYKTPTAPDDSAPSPAASAPVAVSSTRPVCACGQTIWTNNLVRSPRALCSDCEQEFDREPFERRANVVPLDRRIAETKSDDAPECAWSTPTSDGEGWR